MKKNFIYLVTSLFITLFLNKIYGQDLIIDYKAKLLYNTTRLVEWPNEYKNQDFIIGVLGDTTLSNHLKNLIESRTVGANNIIVKEIQSTENIGKVHVLFISSLKSSTKNIHRILKILEGKSTLIITEKPGLIKLGAAINFVLINDILKFELNESNASKYGLKISSRLKHLAIVN